MKLATTAAISVWALLLIVGYIVAPSLLHWDGPWVAAWYGLGWILVVVLLCLPMAVWSSLPDRRR